MVRYDSPPFRIPSFDSKLASWEGIVGSLALLQGGLEHVALHIRRSGGSAEYRKSLAMIEIHRKQGGRKGLAPAPQKKVKDV